MATFPIVKSQRTMPGSAGNIRGNLPMLGAEAEAFRAMTKAGEAGADIAIAREEHKFTKAQLEAQDVLTNYAKSLGENKDDESYQQDFDKALQEINKLDPGGLAGLRFRRWVAQITPGMKRSINKSIERRVADTWAVDLDVLTQRAVENGGMGIVSVYEKLNEGVFHGWMTAAKAKDHLDKVEYNSQRNGQATAALTDPEKFLKEVTTFEELKKRFPKAVPNDLPYLIGMAEGQKGNLEGQQMKAAEKMETDISNDIIKTEDQVSSANILTKIQTAGDSGILNGTQIRVLKNFLDNQRGNSGKTATQVQMGEAYDKIYNSIESGNKENARESWRENAWMFTSAKNQEILKDIREIGTTTINNEIHKQYLSAITSLAMGKMFSSDTTKNINLSLEAKNLLRMFAKQNPDATAEDYAKFFNRLVENQTSFWTGAFTGKSFWQSLRREKGELRYSIPRNIESIQKEFGAAKTDDLSSLSDEELLKRIMSK